MTATEDPKSGQTLRAAVEMPRSIVADAAMVGFRREEGDWSERLFANQASLTDALKAPFPVPLEVRLVSPETWWRTRLDGSEYSYTNSLLLKEEWKAQGLALEDFRIEAAQDGFLHRLIENAFSWALQDCNYLNPKYMDRLIAETIRGMNPEQAAEWNATAPQQAARNSAMETNTND